jgi:hypothetical protein
VTDRAVKVDKAAAAAKVTTHRKRSRGVGPGDRQPVPAQPQRSLGIISALGRKNLGFSATRNS